MNKSTNHNSISYLLLTVVYTSMFLVLSTIVLMFRINLDILCNINDNISLLTIIISSISLSQTLSFDHLTRIPGMQSRGDVEIFFDSLKECRKVLWTLIIWSLLLRILCSYLLLNDLTITTENEAIIDLTFRGVSILIMVINFRLLAGSVIEFNGIKDLKDDMLENSYRD